MPRDSRDALNIKHALSRDTRSLPFRNRLRAHFESLGEGELTAAGLGGDLNSGWRGRDVVRQIAGIHMPRRLHRRCISINREAIGAPYSPADNQPMVKAPSRKPAELLLPHERVPLTAYSAFDEWLKALLSRRGMKARCKDALGVGAQNVTKWLKGSIPQPATLRALAEWAGVDYVDLRLLADGNKPRAVEDAPSSRKLWTKTEMGAIVGRKWEELHSHDSVGAMQWLNYMEVMINLHRSSHRELIERERVSFEARRRETNAAEK